MNTVKKYSSTSVGKKINPKQLRSGLLPARGQHNGWGDGGKVGGRVWAHRQHVKLRGGRKRGVENKGRKRKGKKGKGEKEREGTRIREEEGGKKQGKGGRGKEGNKGKCGSGKGGNKSNDGRGIEQQRKGRKRKGMKGG